MLKKKTTQKEKKLPQNAKKKMLNKTLKQNQKYPEIASTKKK